jgi:hypothetical protein
MDNEYYVNELLNAIRDGFFNGVSSSDGEYVDHLGKRAIREGDLYGSWMKGYGKMVHTYLIQNGYIYKNANGFLVLTEKGEATDHISVKPILSEDEVIFNTLLVLKTAKSVIKQFGKSPLTVLEIDEQIQELKGKFKPSRDPQLSNLRYS